MNSNDAAATPPHELLRLHVEAVWGIAVPSLAGYEAMLADDVAPPWAAYHARLAEGDLRIWRADVLPEERAELAAITGRALAHPNEAIAGVTREVALLPTAAPRMTYAEAERLAHRLGPADAPLV
ncbi:MAG: hypothetical protein ACRDHE_11065, partial [Ktedonobacterales bacterium]